MCVFFCFAVHVASVGVVGVVDVVGVGSDDVGGVVAIVVVVVCVVVCVVIRSISCHVVDGNGIGVVACGDGVVYGGCYGGVVVVVGDYGWCCSGCY